MEIVAEWNLSMSIVSRIMLYWRSNGSRWLGGLCWSDGPKYFMLYSKVERTLKTAYTSSCVEDRTVWWRLRTKWRSGSLLRPQTEWISDYLWRPRTDGTRRRVKGWADRDRTDSLLLFQVGQAGTCQKHSDAQVSKMNERLV